MKKGFTLLELIIVIAIMAIIGVAGVAYYLNAVNSVQLDVISKNIVQDLRDVRQRALYGQDRMNWGLHFVNSTTPAYYYEMFETPTTYSNASTTVVATTYLPGTIIFTTPGTGTTTDILFNKITGTIATTTSVVVSFQSNVITITATSIGTVSKNP